MNIGGPFRDKSKSGRQLKWYLDYSVPRKNDDGTLVLSATGKPEEKRCRPYYASKAKAEADKARILEQYAETGSGNFLFDRKAAGEFETAKKIVGAVSRCRPAGPCESHDVPARSPCLCPDGAGLGVRCVRPSTATSISLASLGFPIRFMVEAMIVYARVPERAA